MIWTKPQILEHLNKQSDDDSIYELKKKQTKSIRSTLQNNYYWGVVIPIISQFHGYFEVETHELIKSIFKLETTTWLDTTEFTWLVKNIREIWQTKYWVIIPEPTWWLDEQNLFNNN